MRILNFLSLNYSFKIFGLQTMGVLNFLKKFGPQTIGVLNF